MNVLFENILERKNLQKFLEVKKKKKNGKVLKYSDVNPVNLTCNHANPSKSRPGINFALHQSCE